MYLLSEPSHLKPLRQGCKIVQDKMLTLLQGTKKKSTKMIFIKRTLEMGRLYMEMCFLMKLFI